MAEALDEKLKVFVSYSRQDSSEFAEELVAGLELAGFAAFLDRHDIAVGEDWQARLGGLILQADTVVFVISPAAVKSPRCQWEIDATLKLSKRLVPVVFKAVPDLDIPEQLGRLQFVRFDTQLGLVQALAQLASALRQDLDWIREHTRLGELAARWEARNRVEALLLRGEELTAARAWATKRQIDAPAITDLQRTFLNASEAADTARLDKERQQLEDIRLAQEARAASQKRAARMLWISGIVVVALLVFTIGLGLFIYSQNQKIESASLRLRAGIKLKIAQTDHVVNATEKWYGVVTDSKLSIGLIREATKATSFGTGFLLRGTSLYGKWDAKPVLLTAGHVLGSRIGQKDGGIDIAKFNATFPALSDDKSIRLERLIFLSDTLDVAILSVAGTLPRNAEPINQTIFPSPKDVLSGIAILHWTASDGFTLGFGHGIPPPQGATEGRDGVYYYTHVTGPGASGAPVFDADTGHLVCLHQAGQAAGRRPWGACISLAKIVEAIGAQEAANR